MEYSNRPSRLWAIATSTLLVSLVGAGFAPGITDHVPEWDTAVLARSSGGRSGGGSFRSSPSRSSGSASGSSRSSSGSSRSSSPGRSYSSPGRSYSSPRRSYPPRRSYDWDYQPYPRRGSYNGPVILPVPAGPPVYVPSGPPTYSDPNWNSSNRTRTGSSSQPGSTTAPQGQTEDDGNWILGLIVLGITGAIALFLAYLIFRVLRNMLGGGAIAASELDNNQVTVSKVQVALLAQAREIQAELTNLSLRVDTSTSEGLLQLLQESALALLRTPENWSHVVGSSQTVPDLTAAETMFNRLSIAERSKFSVETLTNVAGRVNRHQGFKPDPNEDPAAYIVVTLLVGTAHDKPLFSAIRTSEELKTVLETLASMPAEYLLVFELLWSPQEATDSLTYDELLTEYADMAQI